MHWMLNVVTGEIGYPAAVLIRGIEGAEGPARLTRALNITGALNGTLASKGSGLWFTDCGSPPARNAILRTARIGVDYAGPVWSAKPYRFLLKPGVDGRREFPGSCGVSLCFWGLPGGRARSAICGGPP